MRPLCQSLWPIPRPADDAALADLPPVPRPSASRVLSQIFSRGRRGLGIHSPAVAGLVAPTAAQVRRHGRVCARSILWSWLATGLAGTSGALYAYGGQLPIAWVAAACAAQCIASQQAFAMLPAVPDRADWPGSAALYAVERFLHAGIVHSGLATAAAFPLGVPCGHLLLQRQSLSLPLQAASVGVLAAFFYPILSLERDHVVCQGHLFDKGLAQAQRDPF